MTSLSFTRNTDNPLRYASGVMNYVNKSWGIVRYCQGTEILVAGGNWRLYGLVTTAETSRGWTVYDTDPNHAGVGGDPPAGQTNVNLTINPPSTALAGRYAFINPIGDGAPGVTRADFYLDQDATNLFDCSVGALRGCMDMMATNYDPQAQINDGSCVYPGASSSSLSNSSSSSLSSISSISSNISLSSASSGGVSSSSSISPVSSASSTNSLSSGVSSASMSSGSSGLSSGGSVSSIPSMTSSSPGGTPVTIPGCPIQPRVNLPSNRFPDLELSRRGLNSLPEWNEAWRRCQIAERALFDKVIRGLQASLVIPQQRIAALGSSLLESWSTLETEKEFWVLPLGTHLPRGIQNFSVQAPGVVPHVIANSSLDSPGFSVTDGTVNGQNYFIPLPTTIDFKDRFWSENSGPKVWMDSDKNIYARNLYSRLLTGVMADPAAFQGGYVTVPDMPIGDIWFRRNPTPIYPYYGTWQKAIAWTGTGPLLIHQLLPGDVVDLAYMSAYNSGVNATALFQGNAEYSGRHGYMTGPLYPCESKQLWGTPSQGFLSMFPIALRNRRVGETHAVRLQRLQSLMMLRAKTQRDRPDMVSWTLAAALGRVSINTLADGASGFTLSNTTVIFPELQEQEGTVTRFGALAIPGSGEANSVFSYSNTVMVSQTGLDRRIPSQRFGGETTSGIPASNYSPFRFSGHPKASGIERHDFPIPSKGTLLQDNKSDAAYCYGIINRDSLLTKDIFSFIRPYTDTGTKLILRPDTRPDSLIYLSRSTAIKTTTCIDAIDRGDVNLRVPGMATPSSLLYSLIPKRTLKWQGAGSNLKDAIGPPLDLDDTKIPFTSTQSTGALLTQGTTNSLYDSISSHF